MLLLLLYCDQCFGGSPFVSNDLRMNCPTEKPDDKLKVKALPKICRALTSYQKGEKKLIQLNTVCRHVLLKISMGNNSYLNGSLLEKFKFYE